MPGPTMTLDQALRVLADIHTKDDHQVGFVFMVGATAHRGLTQWSVDDHINAWRVVRQHLHMTVDPKIVQ